MPTQKNRPALAIFSKKIWLKPFTVNCYIICIIDPITGNYKNVRFIKLKLYYTTTLSIYMIKSYSVMPLDFISRSRNLVFQRWFVPFWFSGRFNAWLIAGERFDKIDDFIESNDLYVCLRTYPNLYKQKWRQFRNKMLLPPDTHLSFTLCTFFYDVTSYNTKYVDIDKSIVKKYNNVWVRPDIMLAEKIMVDLSIPRIYVPEMLRILRILLRYVRMYKYRRLIRRRFKSMNCNIL